MGARRVRHSPPEDIEVICRDSFPVAQAAIALREAPYTRGATLGECASGRKVVPSGCAPGFSDPWFQSIVTLRQRLHHVRRGISASRRLHRRLKFVNATMVLTISSELKVPRVDFCYSVAGFASAR